MPVQCRLEITGMFREQNQLDSRVHTLIQKAHELDVDQSAEHHGLIQVDIDGVEL